MMRLAALLVVLLTPALAWGQGLPQKDGNSSTLTDVETCGSLNCTMVKPPLTPQDTGLVGLSGSTGTSGSNATAGRANRAYVSEGNALKTAAGVMLWDDTFNALAQNTAKYRFAATTQTGAQAGGFLILNNSAITTVSTNSALQTFRTFPLFAKSELRATQAVLLTQAPQANNVIEFGLFTATLPGGAAPTDGCFFRYNAAAELRGVCSYNGTETQTAAISAPSANVNHDYTIVVQTNTVTFFIDEMISGTITLLTDAPTEGQPIIQAAVPWTVRTYIGGSAPALATQVKVSDVFVILLGPDAGRVWGEAKAGMGHAAYQGQNGGTMGTTALYANSSNPAAAVPTNTTAALGTGLGGKFQETVSLAAGTDGIISSFLNPVGTVNQTPRTLVIRGVCVSGVVTVVLAATALTGTMSLAYGHTALSLATAESASFASGTTKAPRRIALGTTGLLLSAAVGTTVSGTPYCQRFESPVVVAPGEYVAVTHNKVSAAPATGAIMWTISFDAYFE